MHRSWNRRRQHSAVRVSAFGPPMDREHTAQDSSPSPIPRARICRWCRDALEMTVSPRKRSPRKAGNDARCRRGEKIGSGKVRFVMSGRDVFLIAPHTGPSTPRPRDHRERDAFARDAAARCDGRRAPDEADRLHQAELREKRRASQTSARGKLPSKRVGEKRAPRRDTRGDHCREWEAAGSQRAVPIRRDVHHDPHRGRLRLRPLGTSVRNRATPHLVPDEKSEPSAETDDASSPSRADSFFRRETISGFGFSGFFFFFFFCFSSVFFSRAGRKKRAY